jgi:uncharacterized protein YjbI with pentapeptide repeats
LYEHDLVGVNLAGQNLTNAALQFANLDNADFSQANLTGATVWAGLSGANFAGATVRGASLSGISVNQLSSTGSYQEHDLSGITIYADLAGVNLTAQNLTGATFENTKLINANFSHANLTNAVFWLATPNGANFSHAILSSATFRYSDLTGANLTGAEVRGASFLRDEPGGIGYVSTGLTAAQLYSTASYQAHDLAGINLQLNELAGVDLAGTNLTNAGFSGAVLVNADFSGANLANADFSAPPAFFYVYTNLTGANLSQTNLTNARFNGRFDGNEWVPAADLTGANLSGSDTRGTDFSFTFAWTAPITTNLIHPNGHIAGLDLTAGKSLVVRDYDGNPDGIPPNGPLPIRVEQHLTMDTSGTLRLVFDADPWDSTISFMPGIPVALGGTLELTFAPDVDIATQNGRTIDLFDWTSTTPTGAFTVSSPYTWNLTNLYTTGEVTLAAAPTLPGDFNNDNTVDAADYVVWRKGLGTIYTQEHYNIWRAHFGEVSGNGSGSAAGSRRIDAAVPEPATALILILGMLTLALVRRSQKERHTTPSAPLSDHASIYYVASPYDGKVTMEATLYHRRISDALFAFSLALTLNASAAPVGAQGYTFTNVTDSNQEFVLFSPPTMNNVGTLLFAAQLDTNVNGVFTKAAGGPTKTIALANAAPFTGFGVGFPTINASGTVAFQGNRATSPTQGIYTGTGAAAAVLVVGNETGSPFAEFGGSGIVAINDAGTVAFFTRSNTGPDGGGGIYTRNGNGAGPITFVADGASGEFGAVSRNFDINAGGSVAFRGFAATGTSYGTFAVAHGGAVTTIADDSDGFTSVNEGASVNDSGAAAFSAYLPGGVQAIAFGNGGAVTTIATTAGPYQSFQYAPSINNAGTVAFDAILDDTRRGVFTGPDPVADRVIAVGDTLFGETVADVQFFNGLNDNGDVAFMYRLDTGVSGVALAESTLLIGDYNQNGVVDAADYVVWRKNQNTMNLLPNDPTGGTIGVAQYNTWRADFGHTAGSGSGAYANAAVSEPSTMLLFALTAPLLSLRGRRVDSIHQ